MATEQPTAPPPGFDALLAHLKAQRGFDFTGYKPSSLARRIGKRLDALGVADYAAYEEYLELHPDEFELLFNTILINVTGFFRDEEVWSGIRDALIPRLLADKGGAGPIRVWSAGCASGEETYSIAMLLAEALGEAAFLKRVKIYATDVDAEALDEARAAAYPPEQLEAVPSELRERYFERVGRRWCFRKSLRRAVIFGRNDLVQDAPISRIDVLLCRNVLMYFNAETQAQILRRFHFALRPAGRLIVGKSEMLVAHAGLFAPDDVGHRVFTPVSPDRDGVRLTLAKVTGDVVERDDAAPLRDLVLDETPVAQVVVDAGSVVQLANQQARSLLTVGALDIGRPFKDLELSYRPVELRSHLDRVLSERISIALDTLVHAGRDGDERALQVRLTPLLAGDEVLGVSITFDDVTAARRLQDDLERSREELENSYEELQATVEELETTNEELQSTNEELETTNEELQSTNEELETMNEELQSTNEELGSINDELRRRTYEVNEVNVFMETILTSLGMSVMSLDESLHVQVWNGLSVEWWGLQEAEVVGQHLLALDFGLPAEQLKRPLWDIIEGGSERETLDLDAVNRRGRHMRCRVSMLPMRPDGERPGGALLLVEDITGV